MIEHANKITNEIVFPGLSDFRAQTPHFIFVNLPYTCISRVFLFVFAYANHQSSVMYP